MDLVKNEPGHFEDEDEEHLFFKEIEEIRKISLGNKLKVGYFRRDACAQTDVSELPTIRILSDNTAELIREMDILKKDIALKIKFTQAHYESRLQQEAESLLTRINEKVKSLENRHEEKINVVRKSYQQQLNNAIHVVRASYKNYYLKKEEKVASDAGDTERWKDLMDEIQEKNVKIECMIEQLREYEEKVFITFSPEDADDSEKEWLREENKKLKEDVDFGHVVMEQLRNSSDAKEQRLKDLAHNLTDIKAKLEVEKKALLKMTSDYEHVKVQLSVQKESANKKTESLKQGIEKEIQSSEDFRQFEKRAAVEYVQDSLSVETEKQKREVLATQEAVLNTQTATNQPVAVEVGGDLVQQLDKLTKVETKQKKEIEKLQKQLLRSNEIWEKKFEILKASFHAVKDEMFLRQTLQRQAALLQHASVSYTMDSPGSYQRLVYNGNKRPSSFATGTPLPGIGTGVFQKMDSTTEVMDSSVQGGRETNSLEFQMIGGEDGGQPGDDGEQDDEEELYGIPPLPRPPSSRIKQTASLATAISTPSK
ncbi:hypothetical protein DPEC_G00064580 [Dallia pectoralis]|uniref:Uncharacterized protein n=1 Tax=Dallia pectoralis TaxID=75939 RepID=A0ACC2H8E2_DALPE|nr:hypothetical protein DPEC_G00064580 [Dallia pectoralis]